MINQTQPDVSERVGSWRTSNTASLDAYARFYFHISVGDATARTTILTFDLYKINRGICCILKFDVINETFTFD